MTRASRQHSISAQTGFSLLEMLVAITLVAVIAVGLWTVFRISVRSWSRGTESMDANQRHRSILNLVRKQLASTYGLMAPVSLRTGASPTGAYVAGTPSLVFSGKEDSLQFVSLNSFRFQESPGLTLVSYEVSQNPDGNYSLVEKEARYLGQLPEDGSAMQSVDPIPIFENLSSCLFEYFDPGDTLNRAQWVREWDGQKLRRLPLAVSMTMISRDPRGNTVNRHMVVPIKAEPVGQGVGFINPFGTRGIVQ